MRMTDTQFRSKRQRLGIYALGLEPVSLSRCAIDNLLAVGRPREIGDVSPRAEHLPSRKLHHIRHHDRVVRPLTLDFDHAGERFFVRAEYRSSVPAE